MIAAVRNPSSMPKLEGEMVVVKLDVGENNDAKKVRFLRPLPQLYLPNGCSPSVLIPS